jgi:hypothetical protein
MTPKIGLCKNEKIDFSLEKANISQLFLLDKLVSGRENSDEKYINREN